MIQTLAIENYRSIWRLVISLGRLNVISGANGSGKSNLYRALRLLSRTTFGDITQSIAQEGGLKSTFWAGEHSHVRKTDTGDVFTQSEVNKTAQRLQLGFGSGEFSYSISLGIPKLAVFDLDPEIKNEAIWAGPVYRPASSLVERSGPAVRIRQGRSWKALAQGLSVTDSIFYHLADASLSPEVFKLREQMRDWRFYDYFRTDVDAPARMSRVGTFTPILSSDGSDLASALYTIREIGDHEALADSIQDAFPGASLDLLYGEHDGRISVALQQAGLGRSLTAMELSDGTLRYLLLVAALLTPRPPAMMVLNEPENSLHPDLIPALARLIQRAMKNTQIWVVSHSTLLIRELNRMPDCNMLQLSKDEGATLLEGQRPLDEPSWHWPKD